MSSIEFLQTELVVPKSKVFRASFQQEGSFFCFRKGRAEEGVRTQFTSKTPDEKLIQALR